MRHYISLLCTSLYFFFRPIVKWILRRTTRLCELQRICYGECPGSSRTSKIEYSIDHSRSQELTKIYKRLDQNAQDETLNKDSIYFTVYSVMRVKNINCKVHTRFPDMLAESMIKIWGYRKLVSTLEYIRRIKYDSTNVEHEKKLLKLWSILQPTVALKSRITKQWQELGFQGEDPQTDFRGMGLLGLENLVFFSETYPTTAQHILIRSRHPSYGYSFAIVGINLTHMAFNLVVNGDAKTHFYNACRGFPDTEAFHQLFSYLIFEFDQLWRRERPRDIMEFNRVRNKLETDIKKRLKEPNTILRCQFVLENI